jgi:hypothetical protein
MKTRTKITIGGLAGTALIAGALFLNQTPEPQTNCNYPAPIRGLNAVAFSGETIGSDCYMVPPGMMAVIVSGPEIELECKDGTPTPARLPCYIQKDGHHLVFLQCLRKVTDAQILSGYRYEPDNSCTWEREHL